MGKSAKAFKRPSKQQRELKKASKAYPGSTPPAQALAARTSPALAQTGGGVAKSKAAKLKAKVVAAKDRNSSSSKKNVDYLKLFGRNTASVITH
ncbi:hypothetical protein EV174_001654 [Coemansia sp. RSA 2320]|nr:hypothetical protein EV174_001654 [Coemansia sp. RSA 2320]